MADHPNCIVIRRRADGTTVFSSAAKALQPRWLERKGEASTAHAQFRLMEARQMKEARAALDQFVFVSSSSIQRNRRQLLLHAAIFVDLIKD
jgi:hypothetical protein